MSGGARLRVGDLRQDLVQRGLRGRRRRDADLADFFRRALEDESARGRYIIGDGLNPTVAELTEAAAVAARAPGAVVGSDDEARSRLDDVAEVFLLDQGTDPAKARAELGRHPARPGLADEFRHGGYRMNGC